MKLFGVVVWVVGLLWTTCSATTTNICRDVLIVTDPQLEHTSNLGIVKHVYNDVVVESLLASITRALDRGCHVFISVQMLNPGSCRFVSLDELLDPIVNEWYFGPTLIRPASLTKMKTVVKVAASSTDTQTSSSSDSSSSNSISNPRLSFSHLLGGPASMLGRSSRSTSSTSASAVVGTGNTGEGNSNSGTNDASEQVAIMAELQSRADGPPPPDSNDPLTMASCILLPPASRARCNFLRKNNIPCGPKYKSAKVPPMLVPGNGAELDSRLIEGLQEVALSEYLHVIVKGCELAKEPLTWSLLETGNSCVFLYKDVVTLLTRSHSGVPHPAPPDKQQADPNYDEIQLAVNNYQNLFPKCEKSFSQVLTGMSFVEYVLIGGYMLELTIRETIDDMHAMFEQWRAADASKLVPKIVLLGGQSVAMFPRSFGHTPPNGYEDKAVTKLSMQALAEELVMQGVLLELGGDYFLAGVQIT